MLNEPIKFDQEEIRRAVVRKFPLVADALSGVQFFERNMPTAATDGKNIYFNPEFMNKLTYNEQIFVISHEALHIAFDHIARMSYQDHEGITNKKHERLWNIATDAVINQALLAEGLPMRNGLVNIPEAFNQQADTVYARLLEEYRKQKQEQRKQRHSSSQSNDNLTPEEEQDISDWAKQFGDTIDDHDNWQNQDGMSDSADDSAHGEELEKDFSSKNHQKKEEITDEIMKKVKEQKDHARQYSSQAGRESSRFGQVGDGTSLYNWRRILNREFNDYRRQWSNRRATADNYYQSRIVSTYVYDKPRTEVLLDTSGSVNDQLLRGFLRQLKTILIDSQLYVGCFDTNFYGFKEIRSNKDIDNFEIQGRGGTDLDIAVRAFSKDPKINKVIFTDGIGKLPERDLEKIQRLYWIVFDNPSFKACCGKVLLARADDIVTHLIDDTPNM